MPRRSTGGIRSFSAAHRSLTSTSVVTPTPAIVQATPPSSLFSQMAATAGGVAVGSAVGHTLGAAITGVFRSDDKSVISSPTSNNAQASSQSATQKLNNDRCHLQQKDFMKCLDVANGDSNQCQEFWEAFKDCQRYQTKVTY